MKVQELRIGNWIESDNDFFQIETLQSKNHWKFNGNKGDIEINFIDKNKNTYYCELKYINPVPITEEWLVKFGFKKDKYYNTEFAEYRTSYEKDLFVLKENFEYLNYTNLKCKLEFVHQLQNLYFALTQTELQIK